MKVPSSSGLGHGPLKAKTRVQISLESPIKKLPGRGVFYLVFRKAMRDLNEAELSGRLTGAEVNEKFAEVAQNWSVEKRLPHKIGDSWVNGTTPPDFILATNMISVGLDVGRFNSIIMNSMPRNIAEYIQASSRVAREQKGLVITLHNPFRSRDVSHYEKFREFHEKLYFYVEPISITPFSQKSVEKYLALYLAAIVRQSQSFIQLAENKGAARINDGDLSSRIKQMICDYFNHRYERMQNPYLSQLERGLLTETLKDNIIRFVDKALEQWKNKASDSNDLVYSDTKYTKSTALFSMPNEEPNDANIWTVPMSLRIVEPEAVLHISVDYDGNKRR